MSALGWPSLGANGRGIFPLYIYLINGPTDPTLTDGIDRSITVNNNQLSIGSDYAVWGVDSCRSGLPSFTVWIHEHLPACCSEPFIPLGTSDMAYSGMDVPRGVASLPRMRTGHTRNFWPTEFSGLPLFLPVVIP